MNHPEQSVQWMNVPHYPERTLPAQFADLAVWVRDWALTTERERFLKLHSVQLLQLRDFYQAMLPRIDEILVYLNQWEVSALPADARTLFDLAMTFSETAHPIDLNWQDVDFTNAYDWRKFEFRTVSTQP
jgi:hypothetical protein